MHQNQRTYNKQSLISVTRLLSLETFITAANFAQLSCLVFFQEVTEIRRFFVELMKQGWDV